MKKALPFFRFLFVCIMLCCAGILIWLVPADRFVMQAIDKARDDIEWYSQLIEKQEKIDHVRLLDGILDKQEYLDQQMTPELDAYWRAKQAKVTARQIYSELTTERDMLKDDIEFYEQKLDELLHPEKYEGLDEEDEDYEEDDTNW